MKENTRTFTISESMQMIREVEAENIQLKNALIAIRTRTQSSPEGTTAGEVYKIASRALLKD